MLGVYTPGPIGEYCLAVVGGNGGGGGNDGLMLNPPVSFPNGPVELMNGTLFMDVILSCNVGADFIAFILADSIFCLSVNIPCRFNVDRIPPPLEKPEFDRIPGLMDWKDVIRLSNIPVIYITYVQKMAQYT